MRRCPNIERDPYVAISITDVDELRGVIERIEEDPTGAFYITMAERYGISRQGYRGDPRVIFYVKIQHIVGQNL